VVCPKHSGVCPHGQNVKIRFHYVCGGSRSIDPSTFNCVGTDFELDTTVNGKLVFNTEGTGVPVTPTPQCDPGYLIGWVVDSPGPPIKFDGLIGDAVIRESATAQSAYPAIRIQAAPTTATGALLDLGPGGSLVFDGGKRHYQAVSGGIIGDVTYDKTTT